MKKIIKTAWILWLVCLIVIVVNTISRQSSFRQYGSDYSFPWPGILPDNKLYKLKVLRNKIIEKIIIGYEKKVEFDLLMADKTIYASQLLVDKGEVVLAKDTALKGENYYSMLVQNYNMTLLNHEKIPVFIDRKITLAAIKHQEVFSDLENRVSEDDRKTFKAANNFSKINYQFIVGLRTPKNIPR